MKIKSSLISKANFVGINIFSSAIVLIRSMLFLKYLPDKGLGALILLQAVVGLFGLLQIGLFNGGLRVFSIDSYQQNYKKVNDNIFTYIFLISAITFIGAFLLKLVVNFNFYIVALAILIGGLSLLRNWFSNLLIARRRLNKINKITFLSSLISVLLSLLIFNYGLFGAIISIGALPLSFIIFFFFLNKDYVPSLTRLSLSTIKMVLVFGFIPYLSGIAQIVYNQIDKFLIAGVLSLDELGKFYLATVFLRIFVLVPTSINSLLVPNAINNYKEKKLQATYKISIFYFLILIGYSLLAFIILELFGKMVVGFIFPEKINQLHYLFILLPGIIALTISRGFGFILYVSLHYKAILWNNIFSLVSYLFLLGALLLLHVFTLENIAYVKSIQMVLVFCFLFFIFFKSKKKLDGFYYLDKTEKKINI